MNCRHIFRNILLNLHFIDGSTKKQYLIIKTTELAHYALKKTKSTHGLHQAVAKRETNKTLMLKPKS